MQCLSKWSRNKAERLVKDFYLPLLRKSLDDPLIIDNKGKAKLFISQFYPLFLEVDLLDIFNNINMLSQFTIPQDFLDILLKRELKKLPNGKALGLDKIANKVLKEVYKELVLYLTEVFIIIYSIYSLIWFPYGSIQTVQLYMVGKIKPFKALR